MDISVILATYDRDEILRQTLDSFCALEVSELECEFLIVDNACRFATRILVEQYSDLLPITYLEQAKAGKNHALLTAVPLATGSLLVFTDDDVVVEPTWLRAFWDGVDRWPSCHLFGGQIWPCYPAGEKIDSAIDLDHPFCKSAYGLASWQEGEGPISAGKIWGANMAVKRVVIDSGVTFNTDIGPSQKKNYIMGSESTFLYKAVEQGFSTCYLPEALVHHQIRPEQLQLRWLKGRAERFGRGKALLKREHTKLPYLLGAPRFLIRKLAKYKAEMIWYQMSGQSKNFFNSCVEYHIHKGLFHQYREGVL